MNIEELHKLISNKWFIIVIAVLIGLVLAYLLIKPLFKSLYTRTLKNNRPYVAKLFKSIGSISILIGIALVLNIISILPINVGVDTTIKSPLEILNIILATFVIGEMLIFIYEKYVNRNVDNKVSSLFHIVIRLLLYSAVVIIVSNELHYDLKAMLTALGVGGLAIALALQDTLGNLFAGMQILASKQFRPGDYVKIAEDVEGYVIDINWRNTMLRTRSENVIIVPNSKIAQSITINYFSIQKNLYFKVSLGVDYSSDLEKVERVTLEVAEEVLKQYPYVPKDFHPRFYYDQFADSSINFYVWLATDIYSNQFNIKHHFIKALKARYDKEGIVIPFPIRTLYINK